MSIHPGWSHAYPPLVQGGDVKAHDQRYAQFEHWGNDILSFKIMYLFYDYFNFFPKSY